MENRAQALLAGLFTLGVAALAVVLGLWLARDTRERIPYEIVASESVAGLVPQAAVTYKGLPVGKVSSIALSPDVPGQVLVRIRVESGVPVTKTTFAQLAYQGVTGLTYIALDDTGVVAQKSAVSGLPAGPSGVPRIPLKPSLLTTLSGQGEVLVSRVGQLVARANDWLGPDNQKRVVATIDRFNQAAGDVSRLSASAQPALVAAAATARSLDAAVVRTAPKLDQALVTVSESAQTLTKDLSGPDGAIRRTQTSLDAVSSSVGQAANAVTASTVPRAQVLAEDAARSARNLTRAVSSLSEEPQAVLFGRQAVPGPGEAGFVAPASAGAR